MPYTKDVTFNRDNKFDIQLSAALVRERALGDIFAHATFDGTRPVKIELKSEAYLWERSGNICVEYSRDGWPSGLAVTTADVWVHELLRDGPLCWFMFPIDRFRAVAKWAYLNGRRYERGGDDGRTCGVLIPLSVILDDFAPRIRRCPQCGHEC